MNPTRIALFASGNGSNALKIIKHFEGNPEVEVAFVLANSSKAGVLSAVEKLGIKTIVCTNEDAENDAYFLNICKEHSIHYIILAGFLRKIPAQLIQAYPERIINIHPSLLPKFGGKGMYGRFVHEAVAMNKEKESGITIHFVNEEFDKGKVIAQFSVLLNESDTAIDIQQKVQQLEHEHFAKVIEKTISA